MHYITAILSVVQVESKITSILSDKLYPYDKKFPQHTNTSKHKNIYLNMQSCSTS